MTDAPSHSESHDESPAQKPSVAVETHAGHDLEGSMLDRVRQWTDLLPWIRLVNVLRLAGSPVWLLIVTVASLIWGGGLWIFGGPLSPWFSIGDASSWVGSAAEPLSWFCTVTGSINPLVLCFAGFSWLAWLTAWIWTSLCWTTPMLALARQGALLTAGRPIESISRIVPLALQRTPQAWLVMVTPAVCTGILLVPVAAVAWLVSIAGDPLWLSAPAAVLCLLVLIPAGILGMGSLVAVPSAMAAIINEPSADPLDSLSRGYENLFRRPLHLVAYLLIGFFVVTVVSWLVGIVATGTGQMAAGVIEPFAIVTNAVSSSDPSGLNVEPIAVEPCRFAGVILAGLKLLPVVIAFALSWGLIGGIYLLLRRDCGGQEVEDLWAPSVPATSLPELPSAAKNE
ncbi:hypothetical protein [Crateriforma conspicua]|uniref:hypothetical protein n=1 Tax=Crateriforma conspicua TaxID=2527996 RepID=UPI00118CEC20|nr:hypothetical protein [Crateriforma conspicua]QDV61693.1 hypothetical protein Mal65_08200 [Crateriforma conspicua]